jgi:hypothetical protein
MTIAVDMIAQHKLDLAAIIEECPSKMKKIGGAEFEVLLNTLDGSLQLDAYNASTISEIGVVGLRSSYDAISGMSENEVISVQQYGTTEWVNVYVTGISIDAVCFQATLKNSTDTTSTLGEG